MRDDAGSMACESSAVNFFLILPMRVDQADIFFGFKKLHLFCRARAICCRCGALAALVSLRVSILCFQPGPFTAPSALVFFLANIAAIDSLFLAGRPSLASPPPYPLLTGLQAID